MNLYYIFIVAYAASQASDTLELLTIRDNQFKYATNNYLFLEYPDEFNIKDFAYRHPKLYNEIVNIIEYYGSPDPDPDPELKNYLNDPNNSMNPVLISLENYSASILNFKAIYISHMIEFKSVLFNNNQFGINESTLYQDEAKHKNAHRLPTSTLNLIALSCSAILITFLLAYEV